VRIILGTSAMNHGSAYQVNVVKTTAFKMRTIMMGRC
jgi:hypothetical protein